MNILQWIVVISSVFGMCCANPAKFRCGRKAVAAGMIRGGKAAKQNEWPWLASLTFKSEDEQINGMFFCSGTLISLKTVLTAAHCVQSKGQEKRLNPRDFNVELGRHNLSDQNELTRNAKVMEPISIIAMHPDWIPMDNDNYRYDADIALLIAKKGIEYSPFIKPICLPYRRVRNVKGTTVGWGFSSDEEENVDDKPRQAQLERVSQEYCFLEDYELAQIASNRTFCVKAVDGQPCIGDSGGGFFVESDGVWFILGIVSSGLIVEKCPTTKLSVYTRLSAFRDWIRGGLKQFYAVDWEISYHVSWKSKSLHKLAVQGGTLRKRAFLSSVGGSVADDEVIILQIVCADKNLRYLPNDIGYLFPNLMNVDASDLQIISIERANFKGLDKLEYLNLSDNLIEEIPSDSFQELKKLGGINIEGNRIKEIHAKTFTANPSLAVINLRRNQIESLTSRNFNNINVNGLYLSHNRLKSIAHDAFDGMDNLWQLFLTHNQLTAIHSDTFFNNPKLVLLDINENQIRILPSGLLRNNKLLTWVNFDNNQITKIETTFALSNAAYLFFNNTCVSEKFYRQGNKVNDLDEMNSKLQQLC